MEKKNNNKKTRKTYSNQQKQEVLKYKEENPHTTYENLSQKFKMPLGTIHGIFKQKDKIVSKKEGKKIAEKRKFQAIDEPLFDWFIKQRGQDKTIDTQELLSEAKSIAKSLKISDFKGSYTWATSFKARYGIKSRKICGEEELVDVNLITNSKEAFFEQLEGYEDKDIFNADETALFFKNDRAQSLTLPSEKRISGKFSKERVTIMLCASKLGEKIKPFIIGKSKRPVGYRKLRDLTTSHTSLHARHG